jgi:hypothetical protein
VLAFGASLASIDRAGAASPKTMTTDAAITAAIAFVERERGLTFRTRPKVTALGDGAFVRRLRSIRAADPAFERESAGFAAVLRSLGFVKSGGDPRRLLDTLLAGSVGGFYDSKSGELVVRSGSIGPLWRIVVVHELTHALEDQHFELERPGLDERDDDSAAAFQYLAEGSARVVEDRYRATLSRRDRAIAAQEEMAMGGQAELFALFADPVYRDALPFLFSSLLAPYEVGKDFVSALTASRGTKGLDDAFRNPPATTEQVADLDRYLRREPARVVARPEVPAGATVIDAGVVGLGSLDALFATLESLADPGAIDAASTGWGGDAYVVWRLGQRECFRMDVVMDTAADRAELRAALVSFAAQGPDAAVTDRPGGALRLTSCSGPS